MATWLTTPVSELWPDLPEPRQSRATRWVDQAERLIAQRFRTIQDRIDTGEVSALVVADVVEAMVQRAIDSTGRGGMSRLTYPEVGMEWDDSGGAGTGSLIFLTLDELMLLSPETSGGGAFTIWRKPRPTW